MAARYLRGSPLSPQRSLLQPGRCLPPPAAIPLQHRGPLLPLPALLRRRLGQQLRLVAVVAAGRGEGRSEGRGSRGRAAGRCEGAAARPLPAEHARRLVADLPQPQQLGVVHLPQELGQQPAAGRGELLGARHGGGGARHSRHGRHRLSANRSRAAENSNATPAPRRGVAAPSAYRRRARRRAPAPIG